MREKYEAMSLVALKEIAKERKIRNLSSMKKKDVIDALLLTDPKEDSPSGGEDVAEQNSGQAKAVKEDMPRQEEAKAGEGSPRKPAEKAGEGTSRRETARPAENTPRREMTKPAENAPRREPVRPAENAPRREMAKPAEGAPRREMARAGESAPRREAARPAENAPRREMSRPAESTPRREPVKPADASSRRESIRTDDASQQRDAASPRRDMVRETGPAPRRDNGPAGNRTSSDPNFDRPPMDLSSLDSGEEVCGILEVLAEGYGFIRSDNYLSGDNDVYVAPSQIRRFGLRTGDVISGNTRIRAQQEKFSALLYLKSINGYTPTEGMRRYNFEDMTPIFPNQRMRMERSSKEVASRVVDLFSPIGKGQRGMIVSPPKAGKTTLLKDVARSILQNEKDMHLLILLIDERPEEVTDIREAIVGDNVEVIYSTFDELPEHHKRVSEMGIERAKRLVEYGKNVTILLDSITRLARAYNLTVPPSGRTLSGGLDPAALHMPKRFFGAARNMREGGSLTILATALVDTGSKMDDVVYEEFKGTGNMELVLDRKLSERRIFPAIDIQKSSTRREDLLLTPEEQEAMYIMRKALNGMKSDEAVENILNMFVHTRDNAELVTRVRRQRYV